MAEVNGVGFETERDGVTVNLGAVGKGIALQVDGATALLTLDQTEALADALWDAWQTVGGHAGAPVMTIGVAFEAFRETPVNLGTIAGDIVLIVGTTAARLTQDEAESMAGTLSDLVGIVDPLHGVEDVLRGFTSND